MGMVKHIEMQFFMGYSLFLDWCWISSINSTFAFCKAILQVPYLSKLVWWDLEAILIRNVSMYPFKIFPPQTHDMIFFYYTPVKLTESWNIQHPPFYVYLPKPEGTQNLKNQWVFWVTGILGRVFLFALSPANQGDRLWSFSGKSPSTVTRSFSRWLAKPRVWQVLEFSPKKMYPPWN